MGQGQGLCGVEENTNRWGYFYQTRKETGQFQGEVQEWTMNCWQKATLRVCVISLMRMMMMTTMPRIGMKAK